MAKYFENSTILVQNDEEEVPCAWHNPGADPEGSHGICEKCEFKVYGRWKMSKEKSYVERFRDGKKGK